MTRAKSTGARYALGLALIACLILGGGTARGLTVDAALQILVILCSTYVIVRLWDNPASKAGIVFFLLVLCAGIFQLVPLPTRFLAEFRPDAFIPFEPGSADTLDTATISLAASRTVQSVIFALVPIWFFVAASKLAPSDLAGLIPFYVIGVLCNLAAAIIQYSLSSGATLNDLLGYPVMVGMFANVNHFSTVLFSSIPIILYMGVFMNRGLFAASAMLLILLVLLAAGSMAGILIGFVIVAVSLLSLAWRARAGGLLALVAIAVLAVYGYGAFTQIEAQTIDPEYGRRYFALTTLDAIRENWLFGVGFGAFDMAFPHYEPRDAIHAWYVNHAHNDFLEVLFEGGLAGALILGAYIAAILWRAIKVGSFPLQRLAFLSILMVLVHSTVEYPLRTMAVAMVFAFFNALLFSESEARQARGRPKGREEYLPAEAH